MALHVLLVDDDPDSIAAVTARLAPARPRFQPVELTVACTWSAARVRLVCDAFDAIVLRSRVADADAATMLAALAGLPHAPVVVLAPDADLDAALRVLRAGAADCVMQSVADWGVELHVALERLAAPARQRGDDAEAQGGLNEYAAVLAALLLRRQTPYGTAMQT